MGSLLFKRYWVYALSLLVYALCIWLFGSYQYRQGVADTKEQQYIAQLEAFKQQTLELDAASRQLLSITKQLNNQSQEWKNSYEEIINKEPLPADCSINASRLRTINAAIEQAAATRQSSSAMSTGTKAKQ